MIPSTEIDRRLQSLYQWSLENDIPLFAHAGADEVQARKGYGKLFANPAHWKKLLECRPSLNKLRLCLAHAGSSDYWMGGSDHADWGRTVFELCTAYPNVYCDFGAFDDIGDPEKRAHFTKRIADLIHESRSTPGLLDFSKKILYGSDWYMPMKNLDGSKEYLEAFQSAILAVSQRLGDQGQVYRDFFFENPIAFLNIQHRLKHVHVPPSTKANLLSLLNQRHNKSR